MLPGFPLSSSLRVIGQILEERCLEVFDLQCFDDRILVQCGGPTPPYLDLVGLSYSLPEIKKLDAQARANRNGSGTLVSFDGLPEVLRAIGRRIDEREAKLLRICNSAKIPSDDSITVEYRTLDKRRRVEEFHLTTLRDHAMRMYRKRAQRFTTRPQH